MIRRHGNNAPRKPHHAPLSLRQAPAILTPRATDVVMLVLSALDDVRREAEEAAERRAIARMLTTAHPIPINRPMPVLAAPVLSDHDLRPFATNREPCRRCQTRGDLGCAHQRPFEMEAR